VKRILCVAICGLLLTVAAMAQGGAPKTCEDCLRGLACVNGKCVKKPEAAAGGAFVKVMTGEDQMKHFRITVEALDAGAEGDKIEFTAVHHDDIIGIARRMPSRVEMDEDSARAFAIGMKLFGETILKNRAKPLFADIRPHFSEFMKNMKAGFKAKAAEVSGEQE